MFEASSVYFQYVNEQAAHVKKGLCLPVGLHLGGCKSQCSLVVGWFSTTWVL